MFPLLSAMISVAAAKANVFFFLKKSALAMATLAMIQLISFVFKIK